MATYRLPNGEFTSNSEDYVQAWRELAEPLEKELGASLYAFDPGMKIRLPDRHHANQVIDIPMEVAFAFERLYEENQKYREALLDAHKTAAQSATEGQAARRPDWANPMFDLRDRLHAALHADNKNKHGG